MNLLACCFVALPLASGFSTAPSMGVGMRSRASASGPLRQAGTLRMVAKPSLSTKASSTVEIPDYTGWTDLSQVKIGVTWFVV